MKAATKTNNGRVGQLVVQEALNLPSSELVGSNPTAFTIISGVKMSSCRIRDIPTTGGVSTDTLIGDGGTGCVEGYGGLKIGGGCIEGDSGLGLSEGWGGNG
jgi:hypothetical protein